MVTDINGRSPDRRSASPLACHTELPDWIAALRPTGDLPPLFCACAGGGDVFDYRDIAATLTANQPVFALGVPPLAKGAAFPTVQQLAAIYVSEVRNRQPRGPYRLCGHSFGGLVAYEMAVLLTHQGEAVDLVALIDVLHPAFVRNMTVWERVQFQLSYFADRIARYTCNVATGNLNQLALEAFHSLRVRCKHVTWKILRVTFGRLGRPVPALAQSHALILAAAWHGYQQGYYAGRLVLLNAAERPRERWSDPTLGWRRAAAGPIELYVLPGDHQSLMHPPHVRALVDLMEPYLVLH